MFHLIQFIVHAKTICLSNRNLDTSEKTFHIYGYDRDSKSMKEATTSFYENEKCRDYIDTNKLDLEISFQESFCFISN